MAVKIRLKRLGKVRVPQYRIVVVDSRKKRDGKVIEEIGKYHPKEDPSYISVVSDRAQYWLGVGAQPSEAVAKILKITGDWQKFKGYTGTEGTLQGGRAQARQARDLQRGPQGRRQRAQGRGRDQAGDKKSAAKKADAAGRREPAAEPGRRGHGRGPGRGAAEAAEAPAGPRRPRRCPPTRPRRVPPTRPRPPRPPQADADAKSDEA